MTVADLRRALEGLDDEIDVMISVGEDRYEPLEDVDLGFYAHPEMFPIDEPDLPPDASETVFLTP